MYRHSLKLWKCPAEMPAQQNTNNDHTKRQRVKAISECDTLTTSLATGVCIVAFTSAASAGNVAQHLFALCCCHACMCGEEVHTCKDCQFGEGHTCIHKKDATVEALILHS